MSMYYGYTVETNKPYVGEPIPTGVIVMWSGSKVPPKWSLCDGTNGTPNLINRFIISQNLTSIGQTGGKEHQTLTIDNLPPHHHALNAFSDKPTSSNPADYSAKGGYEFNTSAAEGGEKRVITGSVGLGYKFSIMPPYYALAFIMYTG